MQAAWFLSTGDEVLFSEQQVWDCALYVLRVLLNEIMQHNRACQTAFASCFVKSFLKFQILKL